MSEPSPKISPILVPKELNADATVPQCLDNQYVSDEIFRHMVAHKVGYSDERVQDLRDNDIRTELYRSLTYSSQVVVNRAFFKNNKQLVQFYSEPGSRNFEALIYMIREGRILPFLAHEKSLTDNFVETSKDHDVALEIFLERLGGGVQCVRFSQDDKENKKNVEFLFSEFGKYLAGLKFLQDAQQEAMVQEVFHREVSPEEFNRFQDNLARVADFVSRKGKGVSRQDVYEEFFVVKGHSREETKANVIEGRFLESTPHNHLLELKKLVDLRYNTNLPDLLDRYTFTPVNLPSRVALQDKPERQTQRISSREVRDFVEHSLEQLLSRTFLARQQEGMYLPLFRNLSLPDIVAIHKLDEWNDFIAWQKYILEDARTLHLQLDEFQQKLVKLQTRISELYKSGKIGDIQKENSSKVAPFVSIALDVGTQILVFGITNLVGADMTGFFHKVLWSAAGKTLSESIKGYTVKLVVNMIDVTTREVNEDLSYSIDVMRYDKPVHKSELEDLVRRIEELGREPVTLPVKPAEQTKAV